MAEGGVGPEIGVLIQDKTEDSNQAVKFPESMPATQPETRGIIGRVLGLFGRIQESKDVPKEPEETQQQIRDKLARLQAERLNLVRFTRESDSQGSSKEKDAARIEKIDDKISQYQQRLSPDVITSDNTQPSPGPVSDNSRKAA